MKNSGTNSTQKLTTCALLASLTVLFQVSIGVLPGLGHILSAAGVLPISLAGIISPGTAIMGVAVTAWLTFVILPHEFPLFILCTAPLGLILGCSIHFSLKSPIAILAATGALSAGMMILTFGLGTSAFGPFLANGGYCTVLLFYIGFSFVYSVVWSSFIMKMKKRLKL